MISDFFLFDYKVNSNCDTISPKKKPFLERVISQLDSLKYTVIEEGESNLSGKSLTFYNTPEVKDLRLVILWCINVYLSVFCSVSPH